MRAYEAIANGLVRTYGDLIRLCGPTSLRGTCCACHDWHNPTWQLCTRASICHKCCVRKSSEVLGSIAKAERKARSYARTLIERDEKDAPNIKFYARLAGVSEEFMIAAIAKAKS